MKQKYELFDGHGNLVTTSEYDDGISEEDFVRNNRKAELSPLDGEGMDAMRKAIVALAAGEPAPQEFVDYIGKVEAIKAKHPKPVAKG